MSSLSDIHDQLSTVCSMLDSLVQELEDVSDDLCTAQKSLQDAKKDLLDWALSDFQPLDEDVKAALNKKFGTGYVDTDTVRDAVKAPDPGERKSLYPELGDIYEACSGGEYVVTGVSLDSAVLKSLGTGWTMTVHDLGVYKDGRIDWSHSTNGHFEDPPMK